MHATLGCHCTVRPQSRLPSFSVAQRNQGTERRNPLTLTSVTKYEVEGQVLRWSVFVGLASLCKSCCLTGNLTMRQPPRRWGLPGDGHPNVNTEARGLSNEEPAPSLQDGAGAAQGCSLHPESPAGSGGAGSAWTAPWQAPDAFPASSQSPLGSMTVSASSSSGSCKLP